MIVKSVSMRMQRFCKVCGAPLRLDQKAYCSWECMLERGDRQHIELKTLAEKIRELKKMGVQRIKLKDLLQLANCDNSPYTFRYLVKLQEKGEIKLVMGNKHVHEEV